MSGGLLLTPARIGVFLAAATFLFLIAWNSRRAALAQRKWLDARQRMVSINRVEEGGLGPEFVRIASAVSALEVKLRSLRDVSDAVAGHNATAGGRNVSVPIDDDAHPFVRPRRPVAIIGAPAVHQVQRASNAAHRIVDQGIEDTIFVTIASYRDEQCAPTIEDMFFRARRPEALFVGVVEQHFPGDPSCIPKKFESCQSASDFCPTDHIQMRRINPSKAKGPTFGRFYGMLMYRGETYLFMMDSHNRFVSNWDAIIVRMYKSLPTAKGVLSHYPEAWHNPEDNEATNAPLDNRKTTTYLCTAKYIAEGFPRLDGFVVHKTTKPRPQPWAAAGFLFADARIIFEVPFDPHLNYIFDGEEILYSVRMWTHGWDIFSPNENIMYHYYYRKKAKKFWSLLPHDWVTHRDRAMRRIQYLLKVTKEGTTERLIPADTKEEHVIADLDKYGLGKERTLEDYFKFAGIDPVKRTIENKFCPKA